MSPCMQKQTLLHKNSKSHFLAMLIFFFNNLCESYDALNASRTVHRNVRNQPENIAYFVRISALVNYVAKFTGKKQLNVQGQLALCYGCCDDEL